MEMDEETGISIMKIIPKLDSGPFLLQEKIQIKIEMGGAREEPRPRAHALTERLGTPTVRGAEKAFDEEFVFMPSP